VLADSRLLTTREVATLLAVSPETILRRARAGELPAFRIASNALRFRPEDVEAFLERATVGNGSAS
jgi:excisionase family DNA binding protein